MCRSVKQRLPSSKGKALPSGLGRVHGRSASSLQTEFVRCRPRENYLASLEGASSAEVARLQEKHLRWCY